MGTKVLYLMHGVSGSGKSTEAARLGQGGVILSSDSFFMHEEEYRFDVNLLPQAHQRCIDQAKEAMEQGVSPIVVDNTNLERWEALPYINLADCYQYEVRIAEPSTPWKLDPEELARRNKGRAPVERVREMVDTYKKNSPFTVDEIRRSKKPSSISAVWYHRYLIANQKATTYFAKRD
jgi:predicted kinase